MSHYRLSLSSSLDHCCQLRESIALFARLEGYSDLFVSGLALTVHEAFVNAVRHGNRTNPDTVVAITLKIGGSGEKSFVEARIRDCGDGFDPEEVLAAACSVERLNLSTGRGLLLMHHFTEYLRVERMDGGCVVVLRYIPCRSISSDSLTS